MKKIHNDTIVQQVEDLVLNNNYNDTQNAIGLVHLYKELDSLGLIMNKEEMESNESLIKQSEELVESTNILFDKILSHNFYQQDAGSENHEEIINKVKNYLDESHAILNQFGVSVKDGFDVSFNFESKKLAVESCRIADHRLYAIVEDNEKNVFHTVHNHTETWNGYHDGDFCLK